MKRYTQMNLNEAYLKCTGDRTDDNYNLFGASLLQYVNQVTKRTFKRRCNETEREDIGGEALIKVFKNIENFKGDAAFATWVKAIIENEGEEFIRGKARVKEQAFVGDESYDPGPSLHDKIALEQIVSKLSPPERVLVRLKLDGITDADIAEDLDLPLGTVKSRWNALQIKMRTLSGVA